MSLEHMILHLSEKSHVVYVYVRKEDRQTETDKQRNTDMRLIAS